MTLEALKLAGAIVGLIGGGILILRATYAAFYWFIQVNGYAKTLENIERTVKKIERTLTRLEASVNRKFGAFDQRLRAVEIGQTALEETVTTMQSHVIEMEMSKSSRKEGPEATESNSPRRLTKVGKDISRDLGLEVIAGELAEHMREKCSGLEDFEIHELSTSFIRKEYKPSADVDRLLKKYVYNEDIPRLVIFEVLALVLRDKLLEQNGLSIP